MGGGSLYRKHFILNSRVTQGGGFILCLLPPYPAKTRYSDRRNLSEFLLSSSFFFFFSNSTSFRVLKAKSSCLGAGRPVMNDISARKRRSGDQNCTSSSLIRCLQLLKSFDSSAESEALKKKKKKKDDRLSAWEKSTSQAT